jgi:hypothetical protein
MLQPPQQEAAMPAIKTHFGVLETLPGIDFFPGGSVRSCIAARACPLATPLGTLVPQFSACNQRKRQLPTISFHQNGMIRNLPLEEQTIVSTPLGPLPAEQVTFYDSGALKRVFPLNGTLSGYWTQEDEASLAAPLTLKTPMGLVEVTPVCVYFGPKGNLRSLTLWPGTVLHVPTPLGCVAVCSGIAFYDSGALRSVEPIRPVAVPTPLGELLAFDQDAIGISGDQNSLRFGENGALLGLVTAGHAFEVELENGCRKNLFPPLRRHPCDGERMEAGPITLEFHPGSVSFTFADSPVVTVKAEGVTASRFFPPLPALSPMCSMGAGKW